MLQIPEGLFPVSGTRPITTNGSIHSTDYISLKNAQMCWVVVHLYQSAGHATVFALERATGVTPVGNVAIANVVPIWYGNVSTTSNTLTRQTDAISYTMGGSVTGDVFIIFQVDPASLGGEYDCIKLTASDSSIAGNFMDVTFWIQPKVSVQTSGQASYIVD